MNHVANIIILACSTVSRLTKPDRIAAGIVHDRVAGLNSPQNIAKQIEHAKKLCGVTAFTATGCCCCGWGGAVTTLSGGLFFSSMIE